MGTEAANAAEQIPPQPQTTAETVDALLEVTKYSLLNFLLFARFTTHIFVNLILIFVLRWAVFVLMPTLLWGRRTWYCLFFFLWYCFIIDCIWSCSTWIIGSECNCCLTGWKIWWYWWCCKLNNQSCFSWFERFTGENRYQLCVNVNYVDRWLSFIN